MSLLSSLFRSAPKTNMTPQVIRQTPQQLNPQAYGDLSTLSHNYLNGVGTGFGDDFVNKSTNPVAASMRRNYQNVTAPTISSNYSSRGLGNSSLAANAQGLAEGNVESDIGSLMSNFYQLNEQQKKTDTQYGAAVGNQLLSGDVSQNNEMASGAERAVDRNAAYDANKGATNRGIAQNLANTAGQGLSMLGSNLFPSGGGGGSPMNIGNGNSTYGMNNIPQGMSNPVQSGQLANIAGNASSIMSLLSLFGM